MGPHYHWFPYHPLYTASLGSPPISELRGNLGGGVVLRGVIGEPMKGCPGLLPIRVVMLVQSQGNMRVIPKTSVPIGYTKYWAPQ